VIRTCRAVGNLKKNTARPRFFGKIRKSKRAQHTGCATRVTRTRSRPRLCVGNGVVQLRAHPGAIPSASGRNIDSLSRPCEAPPPPLATTWDRTRAGRGVTDNDGHTMRTTACHAGPCEASRGARRTSPSRAARVRVPHQSEGGATTPGAWGYAIACCTVLAGTARLPAAIGRSLGYFVATRLEVPAAIGRSLGYFVATRLELALVE